MVLLEIGEGLCPKKDASSTARMAIYTAVMGNNGDLFVGGSFESRVWNGDDFVDVFHLARFDGKRSRAVCIVACHDDVGC
jgi:hypothetical protein